MKKVSVLFFALLLVSASSIAKDAPILGSWLLTKVIMNGETQELYSEVNFKNDGYAEMEGRVFGTWVYNKKAKTVTIESEMIEEFAGDWKFTKPTKNEVLLSGDKTQLFFMKLDQEKIGQANQKSGFIGAWKLNAEEGSTYIKFEAPNTLAMYTKSEYSSSRGSGTWMYNQDNNTIIIITNNRDLSGSNKIKSISASEFIIEKDGHEIKAEKLTGGSTNDLEKLEFTEDDIIESLNNYEIDVSIEGANIAWLNPEATASYMKNITGLTYTYSSLLEGINIFIGEEVTAKVEFDEDYNQINIEPIFGELSDSGSGDSPFYPLNEPDDYRVAGEASVTVPAGTFSCTVIEAIGSYGDQKAKYYMISNRPGVYAKIILVEGEGDDQKYSMYELTGIEGKYENRTEEALFGNWLMVKSGSSGNSKKTSVTVDFINDGRLSVNNSINNTFFNWSADLDSKILSMDFDGDIQEFKITKLTQNEMVLQNSENVNNYIKWDSETITTNNKKSTIKGYWMAENGDYEYSVIELADDNNYYKMDAISQMPIDANYKQFGGEWLHLTVDSLLVFSNPMQDASFTGSYKITKLTNNVMVLNRRMVYLKLDLEAISKNNAESGIEGQWKITNSKGNTTFYEFKAPYEFKQGESIEYLNTRGLWYYNPDRKILFVGVAMHQLGGTNGIVEITTDKIKFENGLEAIRVK